MEKAFAVGSLLETVIAQAYVDRAFGFDDLIIVTEDCQLEFLGGFLVIAVFESLHALLVHTPVVGIDLCLLVLGSGV